MVTVLVIDDHAVVRNGCRQLLESCGTYDVIEAKTAREGLELAQAKQPDLIVLDLNLPDRNGLDLLPDLRTLVPAAQVLAFTMHEDAGHAAKALECGASGYITKTDDADVILTAAQHVLAGQIYISQPVAQAMALSRLGTGDDPLDVLTRREREALRLFAHGKTLGDIAAALDVSYKTVANTMSLVKSKLNAHSSGELIRMAVGMNL